MGRIFFSHNRPRVANSPINSNLFLGFKFQACHQLPARPYFTAIIGGGAVGSSIAYHLSQLRPSDKNIVVIERDPTYKYASTPLSVGGIRQQFSLKENVEMSLYGLDFIRAAKDRLSTETDDDEIDLQFQEHGYLFLASTKEQMEKMKLSHDVQRRAGCTDIVLLTPNELKDRFPWLNVTDILLGSFGVKGEGWFDPWALLKGFKKKNIEMGVEYVHGEVVQSKRNPKSGDILSIDVMMKETSRLVTYPVQQVVNAAGPQANILLHRLASNGSPIQYPLPVQARKRCVFCFHCLLPEAPNPAPLTVDPTFVWFRSEGKFFLGGMSPPPEMDADQSNILAPEVTQSDFDLFEESIWPVLQNRVPVFDTIKHQSSWAGYYEYNTLDQNALIGFHPEIKNLLCINGFSGHGLQHSFASGRAGAELLEYGHFKTLDLGVFTVDRIVNGTAIVEEGIV